MRVFKPRLFYGLFLALQTAGYFLIGILSERFSLSLWSARSAFDDKIPFLPWTVFPYMLYPFLMAAPLFFSVREREMRRLLSMLIAASALAFACAFIHSPLPSPRPVLEEPHSPLVFLVSVLYRADISPIYFPSLHALHSLLIGMQFWRRAGGAAGENGACAGGASGGSGGGFDGGIGRVLLPGALLVSASTVFVKQHFLFDTAAAFIAAPLIFMMFRWKTPLGNRQNP